jgi:Tfp pilus assembly protein PilZ
MDRVLTDEELNALRELFRTSTQADEVEEPMESESLVEHELQRRFFRLNQCLPAVVLIGGKPHQVEAVNIGLGGVFIRGRLELPVDRRVEMELELPHPKARISLTGNVCWLKKKHGQVTGLGIRFSALPTEAIWTIIANIEQARSRDLKATS